MCVSLSVVSNSLRPCGLWPARLLHLWDFPARILEWITISFSRRSSRLKDWTQVSCIAGRLFTIWATREAHCRHRSKLLVEFSTRKTNKVRSVCLPGPLPALVLTIHLAWMPLEAHSLDLVGGVVKKTHARKICSFSLCWLLSPVWLCMTAWTVTHQVSLAMGFSRQEYWIGFPFPSLGNLPDPGIELGSPALQADSLPSEPSLLYFSLIFFLFYFLLYITCSGQMLSSGYGVHSKWAAGMTTYLYFNMEMWFLQMFLMFQMGIFKDEYCIEASSLRDFSQWPCFCNTHKLTLKHTPRNAGSDLICAHVKRIWGETHCFFLDVVRLDTEQLPSLKNHEVHERALNNPDHLVVGESSPELVSQTTKPGRRPGETSRAHIIGKAIYGCSLQHPWGRERADG